MMASASGTYCFYPHCVISLLCLCFSHCCLRAINHRRYDFKLRQPQRDQWCDSGERIR